MQIMLQYIIIYVLQSIKMYLIISWADGTGSLQPPDAFIYNSFI